MVQSSVCTSEQYSSRLFYPPLLVTVMLAPLSSSLYRPEQNQKGLSNSDIVNAFSSCIASSGFAPAIRHTCVVVICATRKRWRGLRGLVTSVLVSYQGTYFDTAQCYIQRRTVFHNEHGTGSTPQTHRSHFIFAAFFLNTCCASMETEGGEEGRFCLTLLGRETLLFVRLEQHLCEINE